MTSLSKRKQGFVTTRLAKKLKLEKDVQRILNSFNMRPRDFYTYVHGQPHRHQAYLLCLAAIEFAGKDVREKYHKQGLNLAYQDIPYLSEVSYSFAGRLERWRRFGLAFSNCYKTIAQKSKFHEELTSAQYNRRLPFTFSGLTLLEAVVKQKGRGLF